MNHSSLQAAIEEMEAWVADAGWEPEAPGLDAWMSRFHTALAEAPRQEGWANLQSRAHALGHALAERAAALELKKDAIKAELDTQVRGARALKGYQASTR